ncbi:YfcE family phosphodiesterase [Desulfovibrio aminophilus]|nr:YfcE family phosphodiesterase [Desulfovibrio aminophilus]MCM0754688.1 YfcE family phosphodiesterase [Desulfovibrio aminophilus]
MLLAVISDSHLGAPTPWLESVYARHLAGADALVHCGDITAESVWAFFLQHPNFHACLGNCDWTLGSLLQPVARLSLGGLNIAVTHGFGPRPDVPRRVARALGPEADLVCFGHTHARYFSDEHGALLVNPGSLAEGSLALLTLESGQRPACRFVDI